MAQDDSKRWRVDFADADAPRRRRPPAHRPAMAVPVRRWLTAISFTSAARDAATAGTSVGAGLATTAADVAVDVALHLIAGSSGGSEDRNALVRAAKAAAEASGKPLDQGLLDGLRRLHQIRNRVVHDGVEVSSGDVEIALEAASTLLAVLPEHLGFNPGKVAGIGGAVASVVVDAEVGGHLRDADHALVTGNASSAADATARALDVALSRCDPPLSDARVLWLEPRDAETYADILALIDDERKRLNAVTRWVVPLALGIPPARYSELMAVVGVRVQWGAASHEEQIDREQEPTLAEARWALNEVALMVFRLWEIGSLT